MERPCQGCAVIADKSDCYRYLFAGAASRVKWVQAGRLRGCWLSARPDLRSFWPSVWGILLSSPLSNESGESVFDGNRSRSRCWVAKIVLI